MAKKIKQIEAFDKRQAELESSLNKPVYRIAVPLDNDGKEWTACYINKPSRPTIANVLALHAQQRYLDATETLLRSEWIEGDNNILEDDDLFFAAHMAVQGLVEFRLGDLKKN